MIEARGLARTFKSRRQTVQAVRGVDFTVDEGQIVGFLGPNGAGKTTTLRMLTTLLTPTAGTARVAGADLLRDPAGVRRSIGYVPQAVGVSAGGSDPSCLVDEELQIQAKLYRLAPREAAHRTQLLARELELAGLERRMIRTLSGGQRRRLDIALGLVHSPRLVFLDEPTAGLDPQSRSNLWHHIRGIRDTLGTTIFLSTHYLDEADTLCDRILVIDHGRIIASGSPEELKRRISGDVVTLSVSGDPKIASKVLAEIPTVGDITVDGQVLRLAVERGEEALPAMLRALDGEAITMESIQLARPTLDDVFLTLTGRSLRDDSPGGGDPAASSGPEAGEEAAAIVPPVREDGLPDGYVAPAWGDGAPESYPPEWAADHNPPVMVYSSPAPDNLPAASYSSPAHNPPAAGYSSWGDSTSAGYIPVARGDGTWHPLYSADGARHGHVPQSSDDGPPTEPLW
jgi:ABC-2 type transport system ATP-binding protein